MVLQVKLYQMIEDTSFVATSLPSDLGLAIKHPLDQVLGTAAADIVWYRSGRQSQKSLVIGIDTDVILSGKHWLAHQPTIKRPQPGGVYCVDPHNLHLIGFLPAILFTLDNFSISSIPKPLTIHIKLNIGK